MREEEGWGEMRGSIDREKEKDREREREENCVCVCVFVCVVAPNIFAEAVERIVYHWVWIIEPLATFTGLQSSSSSSGDGRPKIGTLEGRQPSFRRTLT